MCETTDLKKKQKLFNIIEAILFIAGEPVPVRDIADALETTELELVPLVEEMGRRYAGKNAAYSCCISTTSCNCARTRCTRPLSSASSIPKRNSP